MCWLCGSAYQPTVTTCDDCGVALLLDDDRVGPTADQRRVRELADTHLTRRARDRVRGALAALPDVLVDGESVLWLSDAQHRREPGVLAITTQALCWVPADEALEAGAIAYDTVETVETWPGNGGQVRVTTHVDLHLFNEVGTRVWVDQFGTVLRAAVVSIPEARALADGYDTRAG